MGGEEQGSGWQGPSMPARDRDALGSGWVKREEVSFA